MKRDWDTIREILVTLEERSDTENPLSLSSFQTDRSSEISYHAALLLEAGLVDGQMEQTMDRGPSDFYLERLTWTGHEFLDSVRSDTVWAKTKKSFLSNGVSMTFEVIKTVAADIAALIIKSSLPG